MQEIANIRIDERLIHGQVAALWTNTLAATRIMIVDDQVVNDEFQKVVLKMACPAGIKLSILTTEKAAANLLAGKYDNDRIFMVLKGPEVLLKLWNYGFHMESVTIGNMSNHPGTKQLRRTINVTDQDIEDFKELSGKNVKLNVQMVPSDEIINFMSLIK